MIEVTRLNGKKFYINAELIETIESTPDTVIKLTNEKTYLVEEPPMVIISRVIEYKIKILKGCED
ncbi:MAG: flagellar FlbD family protein [Thermovenabulum sp.]|uniref:flagellar FlbD family protein n=1 Tax=Thermovenabulum sp. TaxID=3100335 RepID=UPI003C797301